MPDQPPPTSAEATTLPEVSPDAQRVIRRLSEQLAAALVERAMLEDVVQQLVARQARTATAPAAPTGAG